MSFTEYMADRLHREQAINELNTIADIIYINI